jgi:hypothetical protein
MKLIAIGDTNFDGKFECRFIDGETSYSLYFDLDRWKSTQENGLFGGDFFKTFNPKETIIKFDTECEVDIDEAREIYATLCLNGWKDRN